MPELLAYRAFADRKCSMMLCSLAASQLCVLMRGARISHAVPQTVVFAHTI